MLTALNSALGHLLLACTGLLYVLRGPTIQTRIGISQPLLCGGRLLHRTQRCQTDADLIQYRLLEIATAVLCASFPELGPIFLRRKKHIKPSTSIVNGRYRYDDGGSGQKGKKLFSTITDSLRGHETNSAYYDLETYGVQAVAQNHGDMSDNTQQPGEITVTKEIRVATKTPGTG